MGRKTVTALAALDERDLTGLIERTASAFPRLSRADAEDAVSEAWMEIASLTEREPLRHSVTALVGQRARWRMLTRLAGREVSLDALYEEAGDAASPASIDDLDSRARLVEIRNDPILSRLADLAEQGNSALIGPYGEAHPLAKYSDAQVREVRALRRAGKTYREIEEATGIERSYARDLATRKYRTVSTRPGWTPELVLEAIRAFAEREGRQPIYTDTQGNGSILPSASTISKFFGTWREALEAAGLPSRYAGRRLEYWPKVEAARALMDFYEREGRWPRIFEMESLPELPARCAVRNRFGTVAAPKLGRRVRRVLAEAGE